MEEREYADLFQHLRRTVRSRRPDIDTLLLETRVSNRGRSQQVLDYLQGLRDEMYTESEQAARRVLRGFAQFETSDGTPIDGIEVEINPDDVDVYGVASIELTGSPRHDRFVREIEELIEQIREDIEG